MGKAIVILALVCALQFAERPAAAAAYNLGEVEVPSTHTIAGWTFGWPGSTHFLDSYVFQVGQAAELGAHAVEVKFWELINFSNLRADLVDLASPFVSLAHGQGSSGFLLSYANLLPDHTYSLLISGTLGPWAIKGIYWGEFSVSAVPVPPALLLFGSAIAGAAALARRRAKVASAA